MARSFALALFGRVFETIPERDQVTLDELTYGLTHFLDKGKLAHQITRQLTKIQQAHQTHLAGKETKTRTGRLFAGLDAQGAADLVARLEKKVHARAKTDLRLWSPADYPPDVSRESEHVRGVSCLVLDFDDAPAPATMSARFNGHYHILHSTWSHRHDRPKYRLCLPLAQSVLAADWRQVWQKANERAGGCCDGALKSAGATYALPASGHPEAERFAFVIEGPLYDPVGEGWVRAAPESDHPWRRESHFRDSDSERRWNAPTTLPGQEKVDEDAFDLFEEPTDWDDEFDKMF